MVKRVKVKLFGFQNRQVDLDADATEGAVIGRDLRWADGTLVSEDQIRNDDSTDDSSGSTPSYVSLWSLIQGIPTIIKNIELLSNTGLMTHVGSGDIVARTIQGEAGRIDVTNGDGVAGDPTVGLGPWPIVKNSVANGETCVIDSGYQLLVAEEMDVQVGGTLDAQGDLVVIGNP